MIAFGLIRIRLGEEGNRLLKHITVTHVAADLSRYSTARMRSCKSLGTRPGVLIELFLCQGRNIYRQFHIAQLSYIEIGLIATRPAQEDVTRFLHHALSLHYTLPMVGGGAFAKVGFKR